MSTYKPRNSPFYHFDFQIEGNRFHGSTGSKDQREAKAITKTERTKAKALVKTIVKGAPKTLDLAADRFWIEVGQHYSNAKGTETDLGRIVKWFGKDERLAEINDEKVSRLISWRRGHIARKAKGDKEAALVSAATVNRSITELLRAIFGRAKSAWGMRFDHEPGWAKHMLDEPQERVRELRDDEADRLDDAIRPDYVPFFDYARASGQRLRECILRWPDVDWNAGTIVRPGKGKRRVIVPITPTIRATLLPLIGHHPEWVFTYVAARTRKPKHVKGQRYPITYNGVKIRWRRDRQTAGVVDFRFHDFRHDVGTKLLRATGNLKLVQKALNHSRIEATARYAHVLNDEVAEGLELVSNSRKNSRRRIREVS